MDGTRQRILRATAATLSWQGLDSGGEPGDPSTVTVGVTASDGSTVLAAGTATSGSGSEPRTVALTVAQTANLDLLTATWTAAGTTVAVTRHEIVGGFYFTVADLRATEPSLADTTRDTLGEAQLRRAEVESLVEDACSVAFVPRFAVERGRCRGHVYVLRRPELRRVRWVRLWTPGSNDSYSTLTTAECNAIPADPGGIVRFTSSMAGYELEVGYEHGADAPPADLKRESMLYCRTLLNRSRQAATMDRATSMQMIDGTSVTLATPGVGRWHSGIPSFDEVLRRLNRTSPVMR